MWCAIKNYSQNSRPLCSKTTILYFNPSFKFTIQCIIFNAFVPNTLEKFRNGYT